MPNLARESLGVNCQTAALEKGTKFLTLKSRKLGHFTSVVVWNILSLSTQDHNIHSWRPFNFQLLWREIIYGLDVSSTKSSAKELALFFSHISVSHLTHGMVYPFSPFLHWDGDSSWGQWFTLFVLFYSTVNIHVKFLLQALHPISISTETNQNWRVSISAT